MLYWPCFLFTGMKEMVVLIFIQNRSAGHGNQASSDVSAFTYFTLDD